MTDKKVASVKALQVKGMQALNQYQFLRIGRIWRDGKVYRCCTCSAVTYHPTEHARWHNGLGHAPADKFVYLGNPAFGVESPRSLMVKLTEDNLVVK